jgi:SAM-dependent methyltransferase
MICRHCGRNLDTVFLDLGFAPPSNAYLNQFDLRAPEKYFPLTVLVCEHCWLVQTEDYAKADELFRDDYAYFSSVSRGWLEHASNYAREITDRLGLDRKSFVVEVAANDGYLLKNFVHSGIPCVGVEPTSSTAAVAESLGIPIIREFFSSSLAEKLAEEGKRADLIVGNNVYAHVPDINDFTAGLRKALKPTGAITLEFPHLLQLIANVQFDTVYHEHFSYLSLYSVCEIFESEDLRVWDVKELPTHGGSLRVFGCHTQASYTTSSEVERILSSELRSGLREASTYKQFQPRVNRIKDEFLSFLLEQKRAGKVVAGYGAAAKGNTLMNYAGVGRDLIPCVFDAAPSKQGKFLPGSHIPVLPPTAIADIRPDVLFIFPWNIAAEVVIEQSVIRGWGGKFAVAVPELRVW